MEIFGLFTVRKFAGLSKLRLEDFMKRKSLLCVLVSAVMLFGLIFSGCDPVNSGSGSSTTEYTVSFDVGEEAKADGVSNPKSQKVAKGGKAVQPTVDAWEGHTLLGWYKGTAEWNFSTDTVNSNITLTADWGIEVDDEVARLYEENLTWGEAGHLYVHYLRGKHDERENGKINSAKAPDYLTQIDSEIYGDWGLWVWELVPKNKEGRPFYPMKIDESGAVYDIDLNATYNDAGWDAENRTDKGLVMTYNEAMMMGIQVYSQDSRLHGKGFWVNDGGDVGIWMEDALRAGGDYHWFIRQGAAQSGTPKFTTTEVKDPYEDIEPGSAVSQRDVVSNKGNNSTYKQQPVAEGWENNGVGYQIFIASFADSDGDGMGDLRGVIQKLDYLKELGVDTLWLTPFQQSNSYHGYDIMNYFTVDPRFGTLDDYRELLFKAHQMGFKVLLDFVLNHTSLSNPWFIKSQNLVKETITLPDGTKKEIDYRNFYNWQNEEYVSKLTGTAKDQWFKDPNGYYFYSSFSSSMPELNFDYQATRDAILDVALYWMSFGLDGFRLDAVKHIYMQNENDEHSDWIVPDGAYSFDMKKDEHFFMEFNAKLKASYPNALLVGENFNGNPANLAGLYGGLDSQFNFNWYYDASSALSGIGRSGQALSQKLVNQYIAAQNEFSQYRTDYIDGVFTSNHDVQRARDRLFDPTDGSRGVPRTAKIGDANWTLSENLAKLWGGLSLTVPGITWIYNGDELGMFGTKTNNPAGDGAGHEDRWFRQPMKWTTALEGSTYNCNYLMGFNNYMMEWDALNAQLHGVAEQSAEDSSILNFYKDVIKIRKQNPVLINGTLVSHTGEGDGVICYSVKDGKSEILIYVNASAKAANVSYSLPGGAQLLFGDGLNGSKVPAVSMHIYKVK